MNLEDLKFAQGYFTRKCRNPKVAEIKVLDTYRSDHCRHTTFTTEIGEVHFETSMGSLSMDAGELLCEMANTQMEYEKVRREL